MEGQKQHNHPLYDFITKQLATLQVLAAIWAQLVEYFSLTEYNYSKLTKQSPGHLATERPLLNIIF